MEVKQSLKSRLMQGLRLYFLEKSAFFGKDMVK